MTRQSNSAYDRDMGAAVTTLIAALRQAGYQVNCPVTGAVIVDGILLTGDSFERIAVTYQGDLDDVEEILAVIRELDERRQDMD